MGIKGEGFTGTIIKDTWTITRGMVETEEEVGKAWVVEGVWGNGK